MIDALSHLTQFRVEPQANGLVHLIFDCPGKTMNVFSNKAIHELGEFAEWLHRSDVRGVVLRSGKSTAFCAGADLTELGVAYDMIIASPPADRFDIAFNHFFPLSHAIRRLETAGKPIAAAIAGVALGGGCELTLGAHYRVATTSPRAMLGLPEYAVGLLPGAGGTQRMPRLVGLEAGLEVLLQGRTFQGQQGVEAGLINELAEEGQEVAAAEAWLLSAKAHSVQPWDRVDAAPLTHAALAVAIEHHRTRELQRMRGHEPAPLAILDCVELGLMQPIDGAIRSEMSVFAHLIQRAEPRNMIRTMFLGKQAYDKARRDDTLAPAVSEVALELAALVTRAVEDCPGLRDAGFMSGGVSSKPVQDRVGKDFWLRNQPLVLAAARSLAEHAKPLAERLSSDELLQVDHVVARTNTVPAYLGGLSGLLSL